MITATFHGAVCVRLTRKVRIGKKDVEIYLGSITPEFYYELISGDKTIQIQTDKNSELKVSTMKKIGLLHD